MLTTRHRNRAKTGAGAVLAVSPPQVLGKLTEANTRNLKLISSLMISEGDSFVFLRVISAVCQADPCCPTKMAVPTKRDKVTLVNVVNRCLLTPGKMMTNATKSVTKTR